MTSEDSIDGHVNDEEHDEEYAPKYDRKMCKTGDVADVSRCLQGGSKEVFSQRMPQEYRRI